MGVDVIPNTEQELQVIVMTFDRLTLVESPSPISYGFKNASTIIIDKNEVPA